MNDMERKKKKVLFFTSGSVGGAERVTLTVAKLLPREEYDVKIIFVCKQISHIDEFLPEWMKSIHVKIRNIWDFTTFRLFKLIKAEHPDAVFSSLNYLNVRVILAARFSSVKNIIVRNNIGWSRWDPMMRQLARMTYPYVTCSIMQTEEMKLEFKQIFPKISHKFKVIPNPLDLDTIIYKLKNATSPYTDDDTLKYVFVGRIDPIKRIEILLQAFAHVLKQNHNSSLTLVGDINLCPEYFKSLMRIADDLKISQNIIFTGFSDNPYRYIKYANCFVLPSKMEGNPNVLHEAMYLQVPVVATRSIPIIDQIVTSDRGFTVAVDDVNALSEAMQKAAVMTITKPYTYTGGRNAFIDLLK